MANLFTEILETEPRQIIAGDLVQWKRVDLGSDYPNSTYVLKYSARLEGAGTEIEITATASGSNYLVSVSKTMTAGWAPGIYHWQAYITRTSDAERVTIANGSFQVVANRDASASDPRTHARIALAKIEALLEGKADADVSSYSIAGRSLSKMPVEELLKWRNYYKLEVLQEERIDRKRRGEGTGALIKVAFRG